MTWLSCRQVYMGSVLMAKKRYVGFKYEHPDEIEPTFDAKGIETIRRDGFPAQQKIEEVCLKCVYPLPPPPPTPMRFECSKISSECFFDRKISRRSKSFVGKNGPKSFKAECQFRTLWWQKRSDLDRTRTTISVLAPHEPRS